MKHASLQLSLDEVRSLAAAGRRVSPSRVRNAVTPGRIGTAGGQSVVFLGAEADAMFRDLRDDAVLDSTGSTPAAPYEDEPEPTDGSDASDDADGDGGSGDGASDGRSSSTTRSSTTTTSVGGTSGTGSTTTTTRGASSSSSSTTSTSHPPVQFGTTSSTEPSEPEPEPAG
jgi:hypothetical protein